LCACCIGDHASVLDILGECMAWLVVLA
jgi:hypothetical protein